MALLEICCYSLECAITAQKAGADRIELCSAPAEGGLTPSAGLLKSVRAGVTIPVHPIVRPRGGDFCYSASEFAIMLDDIALIRDAGFPGLVTGVLIEDGDVDMPRMQKIMAAAQGMAVTFHRAFDMCANPFNALDKLAELGVARVLTSGQQASAEKGISKIAELIAYSDAPIIMAGAGVRLSNLDTFIAQGVKELHSSAGMKVPSAMRYRNPGVSMSADADADEYSRYCVDGNAVAAMKAALAAVS
ncbi:copper homeostasis protein CutC [Atlantibacter hermannii]|uniref:copper homeostasis protein CutC n=1 Tax=Atlantibacter hermannii TaxID=565 RepID=UPI002FD9C300